MIAFYNDDKGHVQSVQLYVGSSDPDQLLIREMVFTTDKIVLLVKMNKVQSPTEEP